MIVTCPACSAQYVLSDDALGEKGRRVKCTTCNYTWLQLPENMEAAPAFLVQEHNSDFPRTDTELSAKPGKQRFTPVVAKKSKLPKILGASAVLSIVLLGITLMFAVGMRKDIVARAPVTALLFEKTGLPVDAPAKGLQFDAVTAQIIKAGDKETLSIKGKIANNTKKDIRLPKLLIRLDGENGWLKDWPVDLYGKVAQAGTTNNFTYDLKDFPQNGKSITLLFAD